MADSRHKPSKRFANEPKDILATAALNKFARPASEKQGYVIPEGFRIKKFDARHAYGSNTWKTKGGMMGGRGGCCPGVTSHNGLGVVPQAFSNHKG
jgi:hypothetical protein